MSVKIQVKRASAASWASVNPTLDLGEFGLESDTNKLKIGTGVAWNSTDYLSETYQLGTLQDVAITSVQNGDFLRYSNSASAWVNDPVNLSTDTVGNYVESLVAGTGVTLTNNSGEGATPTVAIGQSVATSASVTFAAVTAPLVGNASTATTLQTARTIAGQSFDGSANINIAPTDLTGVTASAAELNILDGATLSTTELNYVDGVTSAIQTQLDNKASSTASPVITLGGDLSGSATLTNLGNATLTATIAANSVALGTDTSGDYVASLVAGTGLTITNNSGEGATPTVAIGQSVATSASPTFGSLSTTGALYVGTDLHVGGVYYTTTETNLAIEDSFIYLNDGNTISNPDLGIAGNYNDGTYAHAGIFSDASDSHKWKFFKGYTPEPTDPINTSHASYAHADVVANTFESKVATGTSPFTVASTTVVTNLNADLLDGNSSAYFLNTSSTLDDISNVSASAPSSGQFLKWNGSAWVPDTIPTINALDDIGDVSASAPSSGQFLKWNGTAWVADSIPTINALDDIGDVAAPSPVTGEVLLWNGTAWVDSNVVRDNLVRFYMEVM